MWIAAIRKILLPALIVAESRPSGSVVWLVHVVASIPISGLVFIVALVGGLEMNLSVLLATTPMALGAYDVARIFLGVSARSAVWFFDSALFACLCAGSYLFARMLQMELLKSALLSLSVSAFLISVLVCLFSFGLKYSTSSVRVLVWVRQGKNQMLTGVVEWCVFFAVSMTGVFLLGFFGGPEVLSGVRLAETLVAPLSIAVSALPLLLAPEVDQLRDLKGGWTNLCKRLSLVLLILSVSWVVLLLLSPDEWLAILVGDHVLLAKAALLGIGLGVLLSPLSTLLTFILRVNGGLKKIRSVRLLQLFASIPLVSLAASTNNATIAGLGLSAHQFLAFLALLKFSRERFSGKFPFDNAGAKVLK